MRPRRGNRVKPRTAVTEELRMARRLLSALLACLALAAIVGSADVAIAGAKSAHQAATGSKHRAHRHHRRYVRKHKARHGIATANTPQAAVRSASAGPGFALGFTPGPAPAP